MIMFRTICFLFLSVPLPLPARAPAETQSRPNILFIYLDDFGWRDTGFMGSDFYETANLDRMAAEGMVFSQAYSASANCAPARASLLSGQYTPRHKVYNVGTRPRGNAAYRRLEHIQGTDVLDPGIETWAERLLDAGYATAQIGKWHLSQDALPYGFDLSVGGSHSGSPPKGYYPPHPGVPGLDQVPADEYLTDTLTQRAIDFVRENRDRPWMVYLSLFAVHTPLNAKRELLEKYQTKAKGELHDHVAMATMIQTVDDGVGRIREALEAMGLLDNTVVLFYSDNGGFGPATDMDPLKGYKGNYYEGGIRVPFFVRWPGEVEPGSVCETPVIGVDLYPTLCAIAGVDLPRHQVLDGANLVPLFRGAATDLDDRPIYWFFPAYLQSYSVANEQPDPLFRSRPTSVIRQGSWKLHQFFEDGRLELYNLAIDIGETANLVEIYPEKARSLLELMEAWQVETGADIPREPNPEYDPEKEARAIRNRANSGS